MKLLAYMAAGRRRLIKSCLVSLFKSGVASTDIFEMLKHTWKQRQYMYLTRLEIQGLRIIHPLEVQDLLTEVTCESTV